MKRGMLTTADGPVVISEKTLRALLAIRRQSLLAELFGRVTLAESVAQALEDVLPPPPDRMAWLDVRPDAPRQELPERVSTATPSEAATLRLALASGASLVLIDGPIKERAKLSFIKCEGTVSLLVDAYREGKLTAVQPMLKALQALGHGDVLPSPEQIEAMNRALEQL